MVASEHEVVPSDEGLARFERVVRFGRVSESISGAERMGYQSCHRSYTVVR